MDARRLKLKDVLVLLDHVSRGAAHPNVGYEDINMAYDDMMHILGEREVELPADVVNSCLWSANLLDEVGEFTTADGSTFDEFVLELLDDDETFNKDYNRIEREDEEHG